MRNKLNNFASNTNVTPATQRNQSINNDYQTTANYATNPNTSVD